MSITSGLLRTIAWEELRHGRKPDEIRITKSSFDKLKAEVESGCLVLHPTDEAPTFNGVRLEVVD